MVCAKCRVEYQEGIDRCPACDTPLVEAVPSENDDSAADLVPLLRTTDIGYLAVIKSVLESSGMPFAVQGEEGLHLIPITVPGGLFHPQALGATILVRQDDLEDAQRLIGQQGNP